MPCGAHHRRSVRRHDRGGSQRFLGASARAQEHRPLAFVELLPHQRRGDRERRFQQRLGLFHLADVLVRRRQQIEIVLVMPVVFYRDSLRLEVAGLERVRREKFNDRLVNPAHTTQIVAVHVVRMRDGGRHLCVGLTLGERVGDAAAVLVCMGQVVMRSEMIRRQREGLVIEPDRPRNAALTALCRIRRFGLPALQPELLVRGKRRQRVVERRPVQR